MIRAGIPASDLPLLNSESHLQLCATSKFWGNVNLEDKMASEVKTEVAGEIRDHNLLQSP